MRLSKQNTKNKKDKIIDFENKSRNSAEKEMQLASRKKLKAPISYLKEQSVRKQAEPPKKVGEHYQANTFDIFCIGSTHYLLSAENTHLPFAQTFP